MGNIEYLPPGLISIVYRIEWRLDNCEGCVE